MEARRADERWNYWTESGLPCCKPSCSFEPLSIHSYYRSGWQPAFAAGELARGGFLPPTSSGCTLDFGSIGGPGAQGQILLGLHLGCTYNPRCRNYHLNWPKLDMGWRNLRPSDLLYILYNNDMYSLLRVYDIRSTLLLQTATIIKADISKLTSSNIH